MTDEEKPDDELEPEGEEGEGDGEGEGEGEDTRTREELLAENAELTRRLNKSRTAKAREARAANRSKGGASKKDESDSELAQENEDLKAKLAQVESRSNRTQAQAIAAELGFRKPAHGVKLLDWEDMDDPSDPDEVRSALREVLKDDPALKKAAKRADGGEGGSGAATTRTFNDMIREAAGKG